VRCALAEFPREFAFDGPEGSSGTSSHKGPSSPSFQVPGLAAVLLDHRVRFVPVRCAAPRRVTGFVWIWKFIG
jgi:hypothetical protein